MVLQVTVKSVDRGRGLNNVVITLILLVIALLLSIIVTYYTTNVVKTRTQTEELQIRDEHVWVNSTGAVAAFKVTATGGRDILLDRIEVRSVEQNWSDVYYNRVPSGSSVTGDMNVTSYAKFIGASVDIDGRTYAQATADIPLNSGCELLIYVKDPDNVQVGQEGKMVSISIVTSNSKYTTELHVDTATRQ